MKQHTIASYFDVSREGVLVAWSSQNRNPAMSESQRK
jgi:hypothetical protein